MSVASEITRIKNAVSAAYTKCDEKGATLPSLQNQNIANLANVIATINAGGTSLTGYNINISGCGSGGISLTILKSDGSIVVRNGDYYNPIIESDVVAFVNNNKGSGNYYSNSQTFNDYNNGAILNGDLTGVCSSPCILKGSKIKLWNGVEKNIEDIDYNDDLLVWNFDECHFDHAKPMWIKKGQTCPHYWINKFKSGKILKTTGTVAGHRFFNLDKNQFLYNTECIGNKVSTLDSEDILLEAKYVEESCEFYNVYTDYHMNLYANDILTGYRYNNLYPIKDMKFVKNDRILRTREEFKDIPDSWFYGMRCSEQTDTVENIRKYVVERELIKKEN